MRGVLDLYFNSDQVLLELQDETDNFFFFEEDGVVKGYMRINAKHACPLESFQNRNCIELVRLYVLKEYHGTGVANKLMNFAIDFAWSVLAMWLNSPGAGLMPGVVVAMQSDFPELLLNAAKVISNLARDKDMQVPPRSAGCKTLNPQ